jgi:hypothetical protein
MQERSEAMQKACEAARHLASNPADLAVLLATWTRETFNPVAFPNESIFRAVALRNGLRLARVIRPVLGCFDHYLFLTEVYDLSEDRLLSCVGSGRAAGWEPRKR